MTDAMTYAFDKGKIRRHRPASGGAPGRGDHDLNPGTRLDGPLVPAAVLVPLVEHAGGTTVMLTRRTEHLAHHPGQISFPGGHMDSGDNTPEETALREVEEETGLERRHVEIIGRLDDYQTRTGFCVTPVVAVVTPPFTLNPDLEEVAEVFEAPLAFFLDPANHQRHRHDMEGRERIFHAMPWGDYFIWGATAGMLFNLYQVLENE